MIHIPHELTWGLNFDKDLRSLPMVIQSVKYHPCSEHTGVSIALLYANVGLALNNTGLV
jgi:hypothetical protein